MCTCFNFFCVTYTYLYFSISRCIHLPKVNNSLVKMIWNNVIGRKIYTNLWKKRRQFGANISSGKCRRESFEYSDPENDNWEDMSSDAESEDDNIDKNDHEESKDYKVGGYHPVNIGDLYEQRYFVIRKLGK